MSEVATPLDVQARLEYARAAVGVLRALRLMDATMRYSEFAVAIGLIVEGGKWHAWHRPQITDLLNLVAATEHQAGVNAGTEPLQFQRVVDKDGNPGPGYRKISRIVTSDPI